MYIHYVLYVFPIDSQSFSLSIPSLSPPSPGPVSEEFTESSRDSTPCHTSSLASWMLKSRSNRTRWMSLRTSAPAIFSEHRHSLWAHTNACKRYTYNYNLYTVYILHTCTCIYMLLTLKLLQCTCSYIHHVRTCMFIHT